MGCSLRCRCAFAKTFSYAQDEMNNSQFNKRNRNHGNVYSRTSFGRFGTYAKPIDGKTFSVGTRTNATGVRQKSHKHFVNNNHSECVELRTAVCQQHFPDSISLNNDLKTIESPTLLACVQSLAWTQLILRCLQFYVPTSPGRRLLAAHHLSATGL